MNKLLKVIIWIVVWVVLSVVFVDYLPQHPHVKYTILISPFILFVALFNFSEVITGSFPIGLEYSIFFWVIFFILLYFPRAQKKL